jgi:putative Holliday junction resolvase
MEMRYLGIDYGEKRVGLALSDEQGDFSYPLSVIKNSDSLVSEIKDICKENNVGTIVIGENPIMKSVKVLKSNLEKETVLPVILHPEFMTSLEAERLQGHNDMHDASAAALILKSYLETNKSK